MTEQQTAQQLPTDQAQTEPKIVRPALKRNIPKEIAMMFFGVLLTAMGTYFFKFPNKFSTGGVTGVAVILAELFPTLSASTYNLVINFALLLLGFLFIGREFGIKTVVCSVLFSLMTSGFELIYPMTKPLTNEPVLEFVFAILLPSMGAALLFYTDASTGGTDIIAMIIKRFCSLNISSALFVADAAIVVLSFFAVDFTTGLFSLVGFLSKVFFVNNFLDTMNLSKYCTVITSRQYEAEISDFVTGTLGRTATMSEAFSSAYLHEEKCVMFVALTRKQAVALKRFVKELDPRGFVIISNTSDIMGKGFHESV